MNRTCAVCGLSKDSAYPHTTCEVIARWAGDEDNAVHKAREERDHTDDQTDHIKTDH